MLYTSGRQMGDHHDHDWCAIACLVVSTLLYYIDDLGAISDFSCLFGSGSSGIEVLKLALCTNNNGKDRNDGEQ